MKSFTMDVTKRITVRLDETKLLQVMPEFNSHITDYGMDEDAFRKHAERIASLIVEHGYDFDDADFVEGYGIVKEAGIDVAVHNGIDIDVVSQGGAA